MWLSDHLVGQTHPRSPDLPLDAFTQMAVLGAATRRIRLSWTVLNLAPHNPAVLAKMLATLDRLTQGRVIAPVGSGWYCEELTAYNVPLIEHHDESSPIAISKGTQIFVAETRAARARADRGSASQRRGSTPWRASLTLSRIDT